MLFCKSGIISCNKHVVVKRLERDEVFFFFAQINIMAEK